MSATPKDPTAPPIGAPFLGYWSAERCTMPGYYVAERHEAECYAAERGDLHFGCAPDRWWPLPPDSKDATLLAPSVSVEYRPGLPSVEQVKAHEERTRAWCEERGAVYPGEGCFWQVSRSEIGLPEFRLLLTRGREDRDFRIREAAERGGGLVVCMPSDYGVLPVAPSESRWRPVAPDGDPMPWPGEDRATPPAVDPLPGLSGSGGKTPIKEGADE